MLQAKQQTEVQMREREVRKIGNSYFIKLAQIDMDDLDLKVGDKVGVVKLDEVE